MLNKSNVNWSDLRLFMVLAECQTLSKAARHLGVNHVTIGRRLEKLEKSLNLSLFKHNPTGYALTLDGDQLYKKMQYVRDEMDRFEADLSQAAEKRSTLVISAIHSLSQSLLVDMFAVFSAAHPNIVINLLTESRNVNIVKRDADIALRMGLPSKGESIAKKMADIDYVVCGQEKLVQQYSSGQKVPVIGYNHDFFHLPEVKWMHTTFAQHQISFISNSLTVQLLAAQNGMGLVMLPYYLFIDSGLVRASHHEPLTRELWMLVRKNVSQGRDVRVVIDVLSMFFENKRAKLRI